MLKCPTSAMYPVSGAYPPLLLSAARAMKRGGTESDKERTVQPGHARAPPRINFATALLHERQRAPSWDARMLGCSDARVLGCSDASVARVATAAH